MLETSEIDGQTVLRSTGILKRVLTTSFFPALVGGTEDKCPIGNSASMAAESRVVQERTEECRACRRAEREEGVRERWIFGLGLS